MLSQYHSTDHPIVAMKSTYNMNLEPILSHLLSLILWLF